MGHTTKVTTMEPIFRKKVEKETGKYLTFPQDDKKLSWKESKVEGRVSTPGGTRARHPTSYRSPPS